MKCICPSGGNRTCPDSCLIAVWHSLPPDQKTKERRRPLVEQLAKQGYTQQAIALQLGVSVMTISRDIETFNTMLNVKGQGKDTRGRKKSPGRPRKPPAPPKGADTVIALADQGLSIKQIANETGVTERQVRRAIEEDQLVRKGREDPEVDRSALSMTAQQKFDAAIKQYKRKVDIEFSSRVSDEIRTRLEETILPHYRKEQALAKQITNSRKGVMTKATFDSIRRCLHPDSRKSLSDRKLAEAFDAFMALEKVLLNEKDSPTSFADLPSTYEGWMKMRQQGKSKKTNSSLRPR